MYKTIRNVLVIVLLLGLVIGGCFGGYYLYKYGAEYDGYTEDDYNAAVDESKEAANLYRAYLQSLIEDLEEKISNQTSGSALDGEFKELIDTINNQLENQGEIIKEIETGKIESLKSMRGIFANLKSTYETDLVELNERLAQVNKSISELEGMGEGYEGDLQSFKIVKTQLEQQIKAYNANIQKLTKQISDIDTLLADIEKFNVADAA